MQHSRNLCLPLSFAGYVIISMDALDQLLVSCHANNLNLFVESFLQMVQKLLESTEPKLQLRATQSVRFEMLARFLCFLSIVGIHFSAHSIMTTNLIIRDCPIFILLILNYMKFVSILNPEPSTV